MRWVPLLVIFLEVRSVATKRRKTQLYMASIDLDTNRKRNVDPEVILDIGSQLPPVKRNVTQAPDYGDYEDYELTAKPEESTTAATITSSGKPAGTPILLDSQFKPHLKISLKSQKSSREVRDEVSRLMSDLHREELMRTTVSRENMTTAPTAADLLLGNETMFFEDEEGSGDVEEVLNVTLTTTSEPLIFTTLIQEVKSVPVTARPDPFEHLDYDLTDHSNVRLPKKKKKTRVDRLKKYKTMKLHGGFVGKDKTSQTPPIHAVIVKANKKKTLRKLNRVDKMRKVKYLNQRVRAHNRMRLRKVLSKMIFGSRDRVATGHRSTKLKFVGSNGVVTPSPFGVNSAKLNAIDSKTKRSDRQKREVVEEEESEQEKGGTVSTHLQVLGSQEWDTVPMESSIIDSLDEEPHPVYQLVGRTQVEPSPVVNEVAAEEEEDYSEERRPMRNGLVHVALSGNSGTPKLRMVSLGTTEKLRNHDSMDGEALVVPTAKKPTMLELLIGDFLSRVPPMAHLNTQEQLS